MATGHPGPGLCIFTILQLIIQHSMVLRYFVKMLTKVKYGSSSVHVFARNFVESFRKKSTLICTRVSTATQWLVCANALSCLGELIGRTIELCLIWSGQNSSNMAKYTIASGYSQFRMLTDITIKINLSISIRALLLNRQRWEGTFNDSDNVRKPCDKTSADRSAPSTWIRTHRHAVRIRAQARVYWRVFALLRRSEILSCVSHLVRMQPARLIN